MNRPLTPAMRADAKSIASDNLPAIFHEALRGVAPAHGITHSTDAVRIAGNHLAADNDEPEPTFRDIEAQANEDARAIVGDTHDEAAAIAADLDYPRAHERHLRQREAKCLDAERARDAAWGWTV